MSSTNLPSAASLLTTAMMVRAAGSELRPYALHADVQGVLRKHPHGRNVQLRKAGAVQAHQIERARPSYVQALIIASREGQRRPECERCTRGRGPFMKCYSVGSLREGACANCVWKDESAQCQYHEVYAAPWYPTPQAQQFVGVAVPLPPSSTASAPRAAIADPSNQLLQKQAAAGINSSNAPYQIVDTDDEGEEEGKEEEEKKIERGGESPEL